MNEKKDLEKLFKNNKSTAYLLKLISACNDKKGDDFEQCCINEADELIHRANILNDSVEKLEKSNVDITNLMSKMR